MSTPSTQSYRSYKGRQEGYFRVLNRLVVEDMEDDVYEVERLTEKRMIKVQLR